MYKKLISSLLVAALLNLVGCYSTNHITIQELNQIENLDDVKIITTDSVHYSFERYSTTKRMFNAPEKYYYDEWNYRNDTLNVLTHSFEEVNSTESYKLKKDTIIISFKVIDVIKASQFDATNTFVAIASIVAIIAFLVIGFSQFASSGWDTD